MMSSKNPSRLLRKWQKMPTIGHKKAPVAEKGHFVVYTTDQKRFVFPLMYLNNIIFIELLKVSEEEFGLSSDGPITLPCDAVFMGYLDSLIQQGEAEALEKDLVNSFTKCHCSFSALFHQGHAGEHSVCG